MRARLITVPLTLLAIGFAACGTNPANENQSPYDIDPTIDPTVYPVDPIDVSEQVWCQPAAVSYALANIPALPDTFEASNFCEAESMIPPGETNVLNTVWSFDPTLQVLEVIGGEMLGRLGTQVFTLDDDGNPREIHVYGSDGFYSSGYGETWYTLNSDGEMVHKVAVSMPFEEAEEDTWVVIVKEQTWTDGVLTRFTERDGEGSDGEDGPLIRDTTWQYDNDGRLTLATATDRSNPDVTRVDEATWTYHDGGQPASVVRTINDVVVAHDTWTFDGNELVSRTHYGISNDELQAQLPGAAIAWSFTPPLDTYEQRGDQTFIEDPWIAALPVASPQGDCQILPRGPGHGYPQAESEYLLGVTVDERPTGIASAYGNIQFHWYNGDLGWYGHHGVGSGWLTPHGALGAGIATFDTAVFYEDGRMVRETGGVIDELNTSFTYARERALDAGLITSDRATITSDERSLERTLVFTRDDDGNILSRSLLNGALEVIESQHNTFDEAGHVVAHSIEPASQEAAAELDPSNGRFTGFGSYTAEPAEWSWTYDGDNVVERVGPDLRQTIQYDERGNTIASQGSFLSTIDGFLTWAYNDADDEIESCWSADGETYRCSRTIYDASSRVAWYEQTDSNGEFYVSAAYDYSCSE